METIAQRYRRRADAVVRLVAGVDPARWAGPSPCAAWTARDVVDHLVMMHGAMLGPLGRAPSPAPAVADDPLAAIASAVGDVTAVLDDPVLAATTCTSPAGTMTAARQIDEVLSDDLVVHAWDLARATGQDDVMDPDDVARLWASTTAIPTEVMATFRTPGAFGPGIEVYGPEVVVPEDARLQDRLLGLLGRDPRWVPAIR